MPALRQWAITPWVMNGDGGWKQQPVIVIEGEVPFFADHPSAYIKKLRQMHGDPTLARASFWTYIGQLKDGLDQTWKITSAPLLEVADGKTTNGSRGQQ